MRAFYFTPIGSNQNVLRAGLAHRNQLRIRYGSHHQQQQKDRCYDEFDPFPTRVREPSKHCVDHDWPPSSAWPLSFLRMDFR
jgi:hypothetical protein